MSKQVKKNKFVLNSSIMILGITMFLVVSALIGIKNGYEYGWLSGADYGINRVTEIASQEITRQNETIAQLNSELEDKNQQIAMQEEVMMNFGSLEAGQADFNEIEKNSKNLTNLVCSEENLNQVYCSKDDKQVLSCGKITLNKLDGSSEVSYRETVLENCDLNEFCDSKVGRCVRRKELSL